MSGQLGKCGRYGAVAIVVCALGVIWGIQSRLAQSQTRAAPSAWGSDHVGQLVPEYVTGDECLFCHRNTSWAKNPHQRTVREVEPGSAALRELKGPYPNRMAEVKLVLGERRRVRYLKPAQEYGKLDLLNAQWIPGALGVGFLAQTDGRPPVWDSHRFADGCAGCHATAVDPKTRAFSSPSLDCYVCHGVVDVKHSKDPALILLSKKRRDPARVVVAICAQCHLRGGKSKSTGLPYPDNFVAGDNLFRDFQADFSSEHVAKLNPADRHVWENVRDVAVSGKEDTTCLSCHDVHGVSSKKHHRVAAGPICLDCHNKEGPRKNRPAYKIHSTTCEY